MKSRLKTLGTLGVMLLIISSCINSEKRNNSANQNSSDENPLSVLNDSENAIANQADAILTTYLFLKDALVNDDGKIAAEAGDDLTRQLKDFESDSYDESDQEKLNEIVKDAARRAQYISENTIDLQRKYFDALSNDIIDLIGIVGTTKKLYQVYCPMYNNDKGAQWLSDTEEIKNPYFGNEKMSCGEIVKEIN